MDEREFKHHIKDLAEGHHHPDEHDWDRDPTVQGNAPAGEVTHAKGARVKKTRKPAGRGGTVERKSPR